MTITAPVPQVAIGYAHAPQYNWWLYENETTTELIWPQSVYVYDQMRRTDSQVTSVLRAMTLPVRRTPWRIDPNGARPEVVQLVADDLGLPIVGGKVTAPPRSKDRFSWADHLRQALLMLPFGHMYFEVLYRVTPDGSRAHLRKLEPRMPRTIERIEVAPDGGLISISQYWTNLEERPKPIPVDRLVAYIHEKEGGNWLGTSILRPAYKNWLLKDRLLRVQAQTIERNGMGIPLATAPENATDLSTYLAMAKAWRAGEAAGTAVPFGATLKLVGVEGTLPDAEPAIRYHDEQIGRAVLAHFLNLGTQTGSWALGTTFADFFTLSLQTLADQIADTATQHIIEDLVDVNFGESEPAPRLVCDEIGSRQAATAEALKTLIDAGVIQPDDVLDESSRQQYGLPPRDPKTTRTPPAPSGTAPAPPTMGDNSVAASAGEPDEGDEWEEDIELLVAVLTELSGQVLASFNEAEHLRNPKGSVGGGRFRSMFDRIVDALKEHHASGGKGEPFKGFDREQLRRVAVKQGITLRRGATHKEISDALVRNHVGGRQSDVTGPVKKSTPGHTKQPAVPAAVPDAESPTAAALRGMFPTHTGEMLSSGYYNDQVTSALANPGYDERRAKINRLVKEIGEPEARRIAWEADAEQALGRHIAVNRPEDPNADPYADLPPVTSAEMAQGKVDAAQALKERFAAKKIVVRTRADSVAQILHDGRMKNAFETGRSGGDSKASASYRKHRADIEQILFGLPTDTDPKKRPIYAHLRDEVTAVDPDAGDILGSYGDVQIALKDTVRSHATASVGDSIDDKVLPSPIDNPAWYSTNHIFGRYDEVQIHGGVSTSDIEQVVFPSKPSEALRHQLDAAGVPWRVAVVGQPSEPAPSPAASSVASKAVGEATSAGPATKMAELNAMSALDARDRLDSMTRPEVYALAQHLGEKVISKHRKRELVDLVLTHHQGDAKQAISIDAPSTTQALADQAKPMPIRDLLNADDATIVATLKDVYQGKFGPYTTKAEVSITRAGTKVDRRGRTQKVEPSIGITGVVFDANGNEIGNFTRSIGPSISSYPDGTERREIWAQHHTVELGGGDYDRNPTKYHGKGFGGAFNKQAIDWYRASGVHGISQSDHNGYVWASQGFNFAGGIMPDSKREELKTLVADLRAGKAKNAYGETIPSLLRGAPDLDAQIAAAEELLRRLDGAKPGDPEYPTAYEVSQLGRGSRRGKTAVWLGKYLKVAAEEMILNPDEGEAVSS